MKAINWDSTYSYDPDDSGGKTLFGVTEVAWKTYVEKNPNKGYSMDLNTMGKNGWLDQISWYWNKNSYASASVNYACAFIMFQMAWGGFGVNNRKKLLNTLKQNADKKDYTFTTSEILYKQIADATHAYTDPMVAYNYMRNSLVSYYYNISTPNTTNKKYRVGWLNRAALPFTPYGLYIPVGVEGSNIGLKYESTLSEWDSKITQMVQNNTSGYVKIFNWGSEPEHIEKITNSTYDNSTNTGYTSSGMNSSSSSSGAYGGCGNIQQLGNFSNASNEKTINQQNQKREEVLKTLMKGSYTPKSVIKCIELLTSDKIKNAKEKSEN
jgi:hypothetical protein